MIRPFTLLCFAAFAGAGAWLYQVKHQVALKDRELLEIRRESEALRQRLDILRAEWALLNEPDRLRQAASRIVQLEPMQPQHFVRFAEIERRLPPAVAFAGAPDLFAPPAAPAAPAATPPAMLAAAPGRPGTAAAAAPAPTPAARGTEVPAPQALAAAIAQQRAEAASRAEAAARAAPARPATAAPPAVRPAVHVAPDPPPAAPRTRLTEAAPPLAPVSVLGGSVLGRPMLAPPVPVGAAATLEGARPAGR